jgi:DNA mismatch repair protein MutS2
VARLAAEEAQQRLAAELDRVRAERRRLMAEAREAGERIVDDTRRRLDAVMAEVRAARSEAAVRQARQHLRETLEALPASEPAPPPPGEPVEHVEPGQAVFVTSLGRAGVVRGGPDARDEVDVEVGALRVHVPRASLRQAHRAEPARAAGPVEVPTGPVVSLSLSVRGRTVDDALLEVDRYLDDAVRARLPQVTIIHGKGTGTLRRALHEFLRGHPHVRQHRLGERGEGDSGATVVTLAL